MNLEDAVFIEPKIMTSEDFLQTNLSGVDLKGLVLNGANLADVNLAGLDLSAANLSRTTLTNADLRGTNLSWTDLSGADLRGTNLRGVILRGANLDDGWYDSETVFPGGFDISSSNMNFLDSGNTLPIFYPLIRHVSLSIPSILLLTELVKKEATSVLYKTSCNSPCPT